MEDTAEERKPSKKRYLFRESVLINAADIIVMLGIFCSFAALIAPMFIDNGAVVAPVELDNYILWDVMTAALG